MVHRVIFWSGFGVAVNFWRLGLEMRPFFNKHVLWTYPAFASVGGAFGYWLQGVDDRQREILEERKQILLEKRAKRAALDAQKAEA
ncbi:hypothetical protein F4778DRAFT_781733 [Xylariomycetidae sp. FL2044]|nr:hypothetical protein F4778DRAFT_781733 [Xylariomycetidae sp. FL2044]